MNILRPTLRFKRAATLILLISLASSLFAYIVPNIIKDASSKSNTNLETATNFTGTHPLNTISDAVKICPNDGQELHEIYLCGVDDNRLLVTNIPDLKQIIWEKLQEGSCSEENENCANRSRSCIWNQESSNTQFNVMEPGEYRIVVEYNSAPLERFYFRVVQNGLNPSAVVTNVDCGSEGSITINNVPTTYEFSRTNGASWQDSNVFSINAAGTYDVLIRRKDNLNGCVFEKKDIVVGNNSINATPTIVPITCNDSKGSIRIDIADASSSYIYTISQGGNLINSSGAIANDSYSFNNLDQGTYDIEVSLSNVSDCIYNAIIEVPNFQPIQPNVIVTKNIDCTPGIISVVENGGAAPYAYSTDGGITYIPFNDGDKTTIPAPTVGTYVIRVKDGNDCEIDAVGVEVIAEPEIAYTLDHSNISCNGTDDGTITVNVTDSQGYSITYSKDGTTFQTSNTFSNLSVGDYTIVLRKEKAGGFCDLVVPSPITIDPSPVFNAEVVISQPLDCVSGSATLTANVINGGEPPFEYSLNGIDFQTNPDFTGLGAGEYTVTIKDKNNCLATATQTIEAGSNPTNLIFTVSNIDCGTGNTDLEVTVENGNAPFSYTIISPTNITATSNNLFENLEPNTYTFEVIGNDGCKIVRNYTVIDPTQFIVSGQVKTNVSCASGVAGIDNGSIEFNVSGYSTTFSYRIQNSTGTILDNANSINTPIPTLTGLVADTYTITVTDDSGGCEKSTDLTVQAPSAPLGITSFDVTHINCGSPGSVTINADGGWGNYTYAVRKPDNTITPFQNNNIITGLHQVGEHFILVRDINGCEYNTQNFDLQDNGGPTASVDYTASNYCYSSASRGELKIDITNGEAPYFYVVNNGTPVPITTGTFTLSNLTPDDYEIKVIGNNGCETIVADTKISGQLFATAAITKPLGCGATPDAIIEVVAQEGYPDPDYTYEVSIDGAAYVPATMPYNTDTAGTFEFKVIDSKNCEAFTDPVRTIIAPNIVVTPDVTDTKCGLSGTGAVELEVTGGTGPFIYSFDGAAFVAHQSFYANLDARDYNYTVRDALGCDFTSTVTIGAGDAPTFTVTKEDIQCPATPTGPMQWGRTRITQPVNAIGPYNIKLIRVRNETHYNNTGWSRTYREYDNVDPNASANQDGSGNFEFDIRMFWNQWFFVEIEDARGCIFTSDFFFIDQPELPVTYSGPAQGVTQSCSNGGPIFDLEITNELIGPFRYKIWPRTLVDDDGDGDFDDFNTYQPFDTPLNQHPSYDNSITGNRVMRFGPPQHDLLFGVRYSVVVYDETTGCYRWRFLGEIEAPSPAMDVTVQTKSISCRNSTDGGVRINVEDHDQSGDLNYEITYAGNPTNIVRSGTVSGTAANVSIEEVGLRNAWYVVSVTDASGCRTGERFAVHRPRSALKLELIDNVNANCNFGAQVTVNGIGGWDNERYYQRRNSFDPSWTPYQYAFVPKSETLDDSDYGLASSVVLNPGAFDGVQNVYDVYIKDGSGCVAQLPTPVTVSMDAIPAITGISVPDRCTSSNELYTVNASITDGTGINDYIWDGEVTSSATKILGPGNHTLEVRDINGCVATETIFIYPQMVSKANITQVEQCSPVNSGEVTIEVYGGSGDYTFEQITPAGPTNVTGIFTGLTHSITYEFEVTDNQSGCPVQTVQAILDAPLDPDFTGRVIQHVSCNGASDGVIIVEQTPASTNTDVVYEYSLNGGAYQSANLFENLSAATNYSVQIRSSKNCIQTLPDIIISEPSQLLLSTPTISDFTCTLENNPGTASITASILDLGGTPTGTGPYNYSFNGGSFTTNDTFELPFTNVDQTVTIDVIDANNCTDQTTINVPASEKVLATIVETQQMNCEDDALIEVVGNNGSGIANYVVRELPSGNLINATGQGIITIPAGNPGNYIYELTDTDTGCTSRVNYEIANFNIIEINAVTKINDISCVGADNGAFSFEVIGFTTGFNYEIFNITDTTVPFRSEPSIRTGTTAVPVENLPPGTYYAVIRDETSKCSVTSENITIQSPVFPLDFTDQLTKPLSCNPGNDAEITVTPTGGWGGYLLKLEDATNNIVIQDFDSNTVFGALQSGLDYRVTLKDARGCEDVIKILTPVAPIDPITVGAPTVVQPSCFGIPDASIEVTATGGQGPTYYQYVLRNLDSGIESAPQSANSFLGLPKGEYEVVVTDNLGCVGVTTPSVRIDYPDEIEIDAIISHEPTCMTDGGITVSATGGSGNFEYQYVPIDENQNRGTPSGWSDHIVYTLGSGTYEFTARDKTFLCVSPIPVIRTIQKVESFKIIVDTSNTTINCHNESDAVLVAQASGGLGGYQYQILKDGIPQGPPQDSGIFENLGKGDYIIVATSGTDCSVSSEDTQGIISIVEPDELIASFSKKTDIQCFGETTGSISIDVQGGVPPYQYIISSEPQKASENHLFQDLEMGSYTVIVQDANGCDKEVAFTIEGPAAPLNVELTAFKDEVCSSDDNGSMTLAFSGGTPPYRYSMESPDGPFTNVTNPGSLLLPDLDGGTMYFVFLKDANECEQFIQHEVKIGVDLTATYETLYECVDGRAISRTTINLNDSEIANKVLYILDAADPNNPEITDEATDNGLFEDLEDGEHIVSIVHEGGCVEVLSGILIRNPQPLTLELKPGNINQILVEAAGGDGNYTYYFDGIPHNNGSYYIVRDGTYTISVEDGKGCVEAIQVEMQFIDIEIPDFFTPNGDGKNDVWAIKNSEGFPDIYVSIFDRYGRQIKEFIREGEWNGTYNDSQLPTGDYWYIIKLNGPDDPREFVGHVTVYR